MKLAILTALLATFTMAPLSSLQAQNTERNTGLPGGHPSSDTQKPGNGDHGNNGGNGG